MLNLTDFVNLTRLDCTSNRQLTNLILSDCGNLTELTCFTNSLTNLDLSKCVNLTLLNCSFNQLTNTNFLTTIPHPEKLNFLDIGYNNFLEQNLNCFSPFINLEWIWLYNNNFVAGSLAPLAPLTKLWWLAIKDTNLTSGLEHLSESLERIHCNGELAKQLVNYKKEDRIVYYDYQAWRKDHPELIKSTQLKLEARKEKLLIESKELTLEYEQQQLIIKNN